MNVEILDVTDPDLELTCHTLSITDIDSFDALMQAYDAYAKTYPGEYLLLTLDDLGQAQYTSMHATGAHRLDDVDGYDLSHLDPNAFEEGEHRGSPTTTSEFFILEENFKKQCGTIDFAQVCNKRLSLEEDELDTLEQINADPDLLLDDEVLLLRVPVQNASMVLSAFPNGYFTCDLNPFENYAVAEHLRQHYGYELFGIGAACLGFRRAAPLDADLARAAGMDIAHLYNCADDQKMVARLAHITQDSRYLFLKYVEYVEGFE